MLIKVVHSIISGCITVSPIEHAHLEQAHTPFFATRQIGAVLEQALTLIVSQSRAVY